jgi:hypothetical protein
MMHVHAVTRVCTGGPQAALYVPGSTHVYIRQRQSWLFQVGKCPAAQSLSRTGSKLGSPCFTLPWHTSFLNLLQLCLRLLHLTDRQGPPMLLEQPTAASMQAVLQGACLPPDIAAQGSLMHMLAGVSMGAE